MFGATLGMKLVLILIAAAMGSDSTEIESTKPLGNQDLGGLEKALQGSLLCAMECPRSTGDLNSVQQQEASGEDQVESKAGAILQEQVELAAIPAQKVDVKIAPVDASWSATSDAMLSQLATVSGELRWHKIIRPTTKETRDRVPMNFELVVGASGAEFLESAYRVGFVEVSSFICNENEAPPRFTMPPGIPDPVNGWVFPQNGRRGKVSADRWERVFAGVQYESPASLPLEVKSVKGSMKLKLATEYENITIANIGETEGRLELPSLQERGVQVSVRRIDDVSIVVQMQGNLDDVADVNLVGEIPNTAKSRVRFRDRVFFQFDFLSKIPTDLALQIQLVNGSREVTLPFDLSNLVLRPEN